tara:strand:- start:4433 stop:5308 length:876 start_codon:yes stop_codon:yes gene_type:complete
LDAGRAFVGSVKSIDSLGALQSVVPSIRRHLREEGEVSKRLANTGFERFHQQPQVEELLEHVCRREILRENLLYETVRPVHEGLSGTHAASLEVVALIEGHRHAIHKQILLESDEEYTDVRIGLVPGEVRTLREFVVPKSEPIATRVLTRFDSGAHVTVNIWVPIETSGHHICGYQVEGLDVPIQGGVEAKNSLASLRAAFEAIRLQLEACKAPVGYAEVDGSRASHGFSRFGSLDHAVLLEHVVFAEVAGLEVLRRARAGDECESQTEELLFHLGQAELCRQSFLQRILS